MDFSQRSKDSASNHQVQVIPARQRSVLKRKFIHLPTSQAVKHPSPDVGGCALSFRETVPGDRSQHVNLRRFSFCVGSRLLKRTFFKFPIGSFLQAKVSVTLTSVALPKRFKTTSRVPASVSACKNPCLLRKRRADLTSGSSKERAGEDTLGPVPLASRQAAGPELVGKRMIVDSRAATRKSRLLDVCIFGI